ncbi:hydroxymethylglutaryl-CoA lyase [Devosia ginsengisoli]|uniref:Hydroxymethylglutaryl-CoA lyase n=1 Tax=Devosia ginsengisoli TaxID=400770 RepID=A0A5B8LSL3_9HYPH|nr:hydroxymethylglutaryl-CoA lyase [Devosia ginsengisoli]QDZ10230.1 hydroxymethylglutaryl-CoA lyase [Devosia ginsengisoli]
MSEPDVVLCECFARDGLQHETEFVATADKSALIDAFTGIGFKRIEATSYSHPERVPAFHDASDVLAGITHGAGVYYKATCPNLRAVHRALGDLDAGRGANELSLLVSATEGHTQRNLRTDRETQWRNVSEMAAAARDRVRLVGVVSVAFGCPFDGYVDPGRVVEDVARFADLGADLVTIGDTIGTATPASVRQVFKRLLAEVPQTIPVAHFHDTRGTGLANCVAALEAGCTHFDSAFGGVGGHPAQIEYGGGYTGNVATEDLVNLLEELGVSTGLDLNGVQAASRLCEQILGRQLNSMVARAGFGLKTRERMHA